MDEEVVQEGTRHLPLCNTYLIIVIIKNNVIMVAISLSLSLSLKELEYWSILKHS